MYPFAVSRIEEVEKAELSVIFVHDRNEGIDRNLFEAILTFLTWSKFTGLLF